MQLYGQVRHTSESTHTVAYYCFTCTSEIIAMVEQMVTNGSVVAERL